MYPRLGTPAVDIHHAVQRDAVVSRNACILAHNSVMFNETNRHFPQTWSKFTKQSETLFQQLFNNEFSVELLSSAELRISVYT